jgi:hypothetical protein
LIAGENIVIIWCIEQDGWTNFRFKHT